MLAHERSAGAHSVVDPNESPIFVIGTGRSGSTLLRQMLSAHPRIHLTHEAFFYAYARCMLKCDTASQGLERYFRTFSFAWQRLDPALVRQELPTDLSRETVGHAFRAIMRCKAQQLGKPRFGEKSPLASMHLGRIFSDFADPRVVFIVRDPRATVASMNRMPFASSSVGLNSLACSLVAKQITPFLDRIYEVKLEDLATEPRTTMQGVLDFVGEPWDDAVLNHTLYAPTDDIAPFPWFRAATQSQPGPKSLRPQWQTQLCPAWIRIIESVNRAALLRYDYEPARLEREPTWLEKAQAVLRDIPERVHSLVRMASMARGIIRHFRAGIDLSAQHGMEAHLRLNRHATKHYPKLEMPKVPQLQALNAER